MLQVEIILLYKKKKKNGSQAKEGGFLNTLQNILRVLTELHHHRQIKTVEQTDMNTKNK